MSLGAAARTGATSCAATGWIFVVRDPPWGACLQRPRRSLARSTDVLGHRLRVAGAPGVDVQAPAARVARIYLQFDGLAARPQVHVDALHALLMEFVVVAKAH